MQKEKTVPEAKFEASQIRLPSEMFNYIRKEASRIGISQNAYMLLLMEDGKRFREAKIIVQAQG